MEVEVEEGPDGAEELRVVVVLVWAAQAAKEVQERQL
jgi:hypothetical protein